MGSGKTVEVLISITIFIKSNICKSIIVQNVSYNCSNKTFTPVVMLIKGTCIFELVSSLFFKPLIILTDKNINKMVYQNLFYFFIVKMNYRHEYQAVTTVAVYLSTPKNSANVLCASETCSTSTTENPFTGLPLSLSTCLTPNCPSTTVSGCEVVVTSWIKAGFVLYSTDHNLLVTILVVARVHRAS